MSIWRETEWSVARHLTASNHFRPQLRLDGLNGRMYVGAQVIQTACIPNGWMALFGLSSAFGALYRGVVVFGISAW